MTPKDLYANCRFSAWRLEAQQHYKVPDDEYRQQAFHAGEPLPPPRDELADDMRLIRQLKQRGRRVGRVHIVDRPLSPYIQYELAVYPENVAAGEEVRIADRSRHPELGALREDFVVADMEGGDPAVMLFDYDPATQVRGFRLVAADDAQRYLDELGLALSLSVPLTEFTAATIA